MKFGRADFSCLSNQFTSNIYVFGGIQFDDISKTIEKYDSILDIWTTLTYKIPITFLSRT